MGLFKKIAAGVRDVGRLVSYVVAAPVNSATGHVYSPPYETPFGEAVGAVVENSVDNVHALAKGYADTLFFNLPSKLRNKIFPKSAAQGGGNYLETSKDYGNKLLNKLNQFSGLLGSAVAAGVQANAVNKSGGMKTETQNFWQGIIGTAANVFGTISVSQRDADTKIATANTEAVAGVVKVVGFILGGLALVAIIFKIFK